jgi:hypothetical protein
MSQVAGKSRIALAVGAVAIVAAAAVYFLRVDPATAEDGKGADPFAGPAEPGKAGTVAKSPATEFLPEPSAAEARILAALGEPTTLEFTETPLQDAVDYLKAKHKIEIQLDSRALEDIGVAADTPVTRNVSNIKLESALRLLLGDMDLAYLVDNEVLLITSEDKAEADGLFTRTYPVGDLIETHVLEQIDTPANQKDKTKPVQYQSRKSHYGSLIEAITTSVKPQTWDEVGGPGSLSPVAAAKSLVVSQTREVHEEILQLLRALRAARDAGGPGEPVVTERVIIAPSQEAYEKYRESKPKTNKTGGGFF